MDTILRTFNGVKHTETITCKLCGQPMHLLDVNKYIVFWVHHGKELEKCNRVAYKTSYVDLLRAQFLEREKRLEEQAKEGLKPSGSRKEM